MTGVLVSIIAVVGISTVLAILLEIAGMLFANYGEVTVDINNGSKSLKVNGGSPLLATLREEGIFIPSACGGRGSCGACKLKVLQGGGPVLPTELPYLNDAEKNDNVRVCCQVKVRNDIKIEIPDELFKVKSFNATVLKKKQLNHDIVELRFDVSENPDGIDFLPGQYLQVKSQKYNKVKTETIRAYSISSSSTDKKGVEVIIRRVPDGICTTWVHDHLKENDKVEITGPYGDFYLRENDREIIMIAGGSGMAPIKSLLHQMEEEKNTRRATFLFGAREFIDLYHVDLMKTFEKNIHDFSFIPVLSQLTEEDRGKWSGHEGRVTTIVSEVIGERVKEAEAYLCGSPGMIDSCVETLTKLGMPKDRIYFDKF